MKRKDKVVTVNPFIFTFKDIDIDKDSPQETTIIGYPRVIDDAIQPSILPDIFDLGIQPSELEAAFRASRSLVVSPGYILQKSDREHCFAVTNPSAPRLSGAPLIIEGQVCGILTGGLPLLDHVHAVKVGLLAKTDIKAATEYIRNNDLIERFFIFYQYAEEAMNLSNEELRNEESFSDAQYADLNREFKSKLIQDRVDDSSALIRRIRLRSIMGALTNEAERMYKDAYKTYYLKNHDALRYNLCLASSSPYFKATILLAKIGENIYQNFKSITDFFLFLQQSFPDLGLIVKHFKFKFLAVVLDENFNKRFSAKWSELQSEETTQDKIDQQKAKKSFEARIQKRLAKNNGHVCDQYQTLVALPGSINGYDFILSGVQYYRVYLLDRIKVLSVYRSTNSCLYIGPISDMCKIKNCMDCSITVCCKNFYMKNCNNIKLYLHCNEVPKFTNCKNILLAPYNLGYPGLQRQVTNKI